MSSEVPVSPRPDRAGLIRFTGLAVIFLSITGLIMGLLLTRSLGDDLSSTVTVSRSALEAIKETIEVVDVVAADTAATLESAAASVDSASTTVEGAVSSIEQMADFLDEELPTTIESIQATMPAAIQTANAIDATLSTLSFFGVDYDPDEPFGDSLARLSFALASLPVELRAQSESLRLLLPSAEQLAGQTGELSDSMGELTQNLEGLSALTDRYGTTLMEAELVIERTDASVDRSLWLIRGLVTIVAVAGMAVGVALISVARSLETIVGDVIRIESPDQETVGGPSVADS
jgi:methyl-accepting chemotaxis protein